MFYPRVMALLAIAALMAGCGKESGNTNVIKFRGANQVNGDITLRKSEVALHAPGAPEALINAAGDLSIHQQPTAVDAAQRALLQAYYRNALAIREHGILTGKAGMEIAGQAIKSVAKGLATGDAESIDKDISAKSQQVTQAALKICQDIAGIKAAQDSLATQLAAFKPYAGIVDASAVTDCTSGAND